MNMYLDYVAAKLIRLIGNTVTRPVATIFTLHRVCPPEKNNMPINEELRVAPEFLDSFLTMCLHHGYNFISMDELVRGLNLGKCAKKSLVISIDDGYKDIFTTAYPILKKHNIPFIFYISTSFPDKTAILWWYTIEELLMKNDTIVLADGKITHCASLSEKQEVFNKLRRIIFRMGRDVNDKLPHLLDGYDLNLSRQNSNLLIDWENIIDMSKDELCTIGAHSDNHFGLRFETAENVLEDMLLCKSKIENKTGQKVKHFSFPYGSVYSVGYRERLLAARAGFTTAVTTLSGACRSYHKYMFHSLPRVNFIQKSGMERLLG